MERTVDFTRGAILKPLLLFALPVLFALFLQALYGAVDLLVVGRFAGPEDVSGVAVGSQLMTTVTGLISSLAMGATIFLAQKLGQGDREKSGAIIGTSITLFALVGAVLTVALPLLSPVFLRQPDCAGLLSAVHDRPHPETDLYRSAANAARCGLPFAAENQFYRQHIQSADQKGMPRTNRRV